VEAHLGVLSGPWSRQCWRLTGSCAPASANASADPGAKASANAGAHASTDAGTDTCAHAGAHAGAHAVAHASTDASAHASTHTLAETRADAHASPGMVAEALVGVALSLEVEGSPRIGDEDSPIFLRRASPHLQHFSHVQLQSMARVEAFQRPSTSFSMLGGILALFASMHDGCSEAALCRS